MHNSKEYALKYFEIEGDSYDWEWDIKDKDGVSIGTFHDDDDGFVELYGCNFMIRNKNEFKVVLRKLGCVQS